MRQSDTLRRAGVAALLLIPQLAWAQTGAPLTLEGAIARAAASNRAFLAAQLQRAVDLAGVDVARQRLNPELSYSTRKRLLTRRLRSSCRLKPAASASAASSWRRRPSR